MRVDIAQDSKLRTCMINSVFVSLVQFFFLEVNSDRKEDDGDRVKKLKRA